MEKISENSLLSFHCDTLKFVREKYNLSEKVILRSKIDILLSWMLKQNFSYKDDQLSEYAERILIINAGKIDSAKKMIKKLFIFKTVLNKYFETFDMEQSCVMKIMNCALLPIMTESHDRIYFLKNFGQVFQSGIFNFYQYFIMIMEYYMEHDYSSSIIIVFDYRENNIEELLKSMKRIELRRFITIVMDGYGLEQKLKGIHYLSSSERIEAFIALFKQLVTPNIAERMYIHNTVNSLYEYIPKDILPIEYGGKIKPLKELDDNWRAKLSSKEFISYFDKMKEAYNSPDKPGSEQTYRKIYRDDEEL